MLAAGAGSRFDGGGHKLSAELPATAVEPAQRVIDRALTHVLAAGVGPVVVITGAAPDIVPSAQRGLVSVHHNERWAQGQATSLWAGIEFARDRGATGIVVGLADQPFITPEAWRAVADAPGPIAVATYEGTRGNPVRLDAEVWHLLADSGDEGARTLMRVRPDLVRAVPCSGSPADIDTTEDLRRWQSN